MSSTEFVHGDYTVGWVCALPKEQTAATAMLDVEHPDLPKPPIDHNTYTLGTVGNHNVVIACLPRGKYGTNSGAIVATRMLDTFPSIKFGLMVGIGGGIPPKVRLGDVVVSIPTDQYPGFVQWDFGKAEKGGQFDRKGTLNNPPSVLLTAYLDELATKWPDLVPKYIKSDSLKDPLLSSAGLPDDREAPRDMQVHYGLIASRNQVVKDAVFRNNINRQLGGNVLCLEIEAAGLANDFPCLVIRGICDYADSGESKECQEHAAAVAAAFAKELLSVVPAQEVNQMCNAKTSWMKCRKKLPTSIHSAQRNQEHQDILDWLTTIERQPGTGQWLLDSEQYQTWLKTSRQTLFCPGIPGAGKTILTPVVVDDVGKRFNGDINIGIAYIYCNFRQQDNQRIDKMLASLLKQLAERQPSLPEVVKDLYNRHKPKKTRPLVDEISTTLRSLAKTYVRVYLLVDVLDECQASDGSRAELLRELFALQKSCGASLFMTSRIMPDIQENFTDNAIELEIRASEEDVGRYLDSRVASLSKVVRNNPKLREDIKTEVVRAVNGMFLLAELHLNSLEGKFSPKDIRRALKALPTESTAYDETYKAAMERIGSQANTEAFAKKVLACITCARRSFTTSELQHALAVEVGETEFDENLPEVDDVVAVCAGLVVVDKENNIIRLVHYTTQQYFERTQGDWFPTAEADITTACVTYLSYKTFESGPCETKSRMDERLWSHQLYGYAANNWGHHARISLSTSKELIEFLCSNGQAEAAAEALMVMAESWNYMEAPQRMTGLHLAAYFGMAEAMAALLTHVNYRDLKDTRGWTPLAWAAMKRHGAVIKLLLENGADADSRDVYHRTPLLLTAEMGHGTIAGIDIPDGSGFTPLLMAAYQGHESIVRLLLETGQVDVDANDTHGRTPLLWAAMKWNEPIVRLLLEHGAEIDVRSRDGQAPLSVTSANEAITKILLAAAATKRDDSSQIPAPLLAQRGYETVVQLVLPNNIAGLTLLAIATMKGHENIIKLLLSMGEVDVNLRDNSGKTPLYWAATLGHQGIVDLLLATGQADVNVTIEGGQTAISMARAKKHEGIVRSLLGTGKVIIEE
ncbi:hypothetical protein B0J15DRAFT_538684 [Fusarium solani]|uniref:Nucleoside phosphorylase domain-containing protein n=1 Tax=Fusarium solani TaxID=169388 RepID=A0A9P9GG88_FUSSL|nr:uncharacterized protein B0J15DRAFT_538684 [Fusarium solani]KAH7237429.1 hypothetical protein B0J15DRAFT_538684 [Fusarium solani]